MFRDGRMKEMFHDMFHSIDSGRVYDQNEANIQVKEHIRLQKFFSPLECDENKLNLSSILYFKLEKILSRFVSNFESNTECLKPQINMLIVCCAIITGRFEQNDKNATAWLLIGMLMIYLGIDSDSLHPIALCAASVSKDLKFSWKLSD